MATHELNRRRLLLGLAAASTAAATVTVTAAIAATQENSELLRLGSMVPAHEAEYLAAVASRDAIDKKWSKRWPSAPVELHDAGSDIERDLAGRGVVIGTDSRGVDRFRKILSAKDLEWHTKTARRILKGRGIDKRYAMGMNRAELENYLDEAVEQHRIATAYETEKARVLKASGYKAAHERETAARKALCALISAIMDQPETSMAGVMVKAQAMVAWNAVPFFWSILESQKWGPALAASIVRVAGEATDRNPIGA